MLFLLVFGINIILFYLYRSLKRGFALLPTKRTTIFGSLFLLLSLLAVPIIHAQQTPNTSVQYNTQNPQVQSHAPLVQSLFTDLLATGICQLSGIDVIAIQAAQQGLPSQQTCNTEAGISNKVGLGVQPGGAIGTMGNLISMTFNSPAHTIHYTDYLAENFGITKSFAQETPENQPVNVTGFSTLRRLLPIWVYFRDLAYLAFVLIFVIVGMAIMLRVKIDPRTVMTIQNQLPKFVIAIVLITISYAIAGFAVDIMWVLTYLSIAIFADMMYAAGATTFTAGDATFNLINTPFTFFNSVFSGEFATMKYFGIVEFARQASESVSILFRTISGSDSLQHVLNNPFTDAAPGEENAGCGLNPVCYIGHAIGGTLGIIAKTIFYIVSWVIGLLGFFVVLVIMLLTLFRIWLTLLRSYVYIILDVIFAPLIILIGLLPNSGTNFNSWLRHLAANLLVFPATIAGFLLARVLLQVFASQSLAGFFVNPEADLFVPPLISGPMTTEAIGPLVAFMVILTIPTLQNQLRDAFKSKPNQYAAPAIFGGVGAGVNTLSGGIRSGANARYASKAPRMSKVDEHGNVKYEHGGAPAAIKSIFGIGGGH
jgi:hypothetical protein